MGERGFIEAIKRV